MAKLLDEFPEMRGRRPGGSKYPFGEWFDGKIRQLDAGEDFHIKVSSFKSTLSSAAKQMKVKIRIATVNDGKSIVVQKIGQNV